MIAHSHRVHLGSWIPPLLISCLLLICPTTRAGEGSSPGRSGDKPPATSGGDRLYARDNLIAWCIVPFDSKKRGPEERAAVLQRLGFKHFAYDWRAEHVPTFDAEMEALRHHAIKLQAFWFPATLDNDARRILDLLRRHHLKTQLWVTMNDPAPQAKTQAERVEAAARTLQ